MFTADVVINRLIKQHLKDGTFIDISIFSFHVVTKFTKFTNLDEIYLLDEIYDV